MRVYIIGNREEGYYKIGISHSPKKRLKEIQTGCPFKIELLYQCYKGDDARNIELQAHSLYKEYNTYGEWFKLSFLQLEGAKLFIKKATYEAIEKKPVKPKPISLERSEELETRKLKRIALFGY